MSKTSTYDKTAEEIEAEKNRPSPRSMSSLLSNDLPVGCQIRLLRRSDDVIQVDVWAENEPDLCCRESFSMHQLDIGAVMIGAIADVVSEYKRELEKRNG